MRTVVKLPHGTGKKIKLAVLCEQEKVSDAKKLGADIAGSDDLIQNISAGKINFDKLICTSSNDGKNWKTWKNFRS